MQELLGILGGVVIGFPIAYLVGLSMNIKVRPHVLPFLYVLIVFIGDLFFVMDENGKLAKKISPIEAVREQTSGTRKVKHVSKHFRKDLRRAGRLCIQESDEQ